MRVIVARAIWGYAWTLWRSYRRHFDRDHCARVRPCEAGGGL